MSFKNLKNLEAFLLPRKKESEIDHGQGHLFFPLMIKINLDELMIKIVLKCIK